MACTLRRATCLSPAVSCAILGANIAQCHHRLPWWQCWIWMWALATICELPYEKGLLGIIEFLVRMDSYKFLCWIHWWGIHVKVTTTSWVMIIFIYSGSVALFEKIKKYMFQQLVCYTNYNRHTLNIINTALSICQNLYFLMYWKIWFYTPLAVARIWTLIFIPSGPLSESRPHLFCCWFALKG